MSCHILGRELGGTETSDGRFYFNRSHFLYQKVIEEISLFEGDCEADVVGFNTLLMAALNNQACIHYEMSRNNDCCIALEKLQGMLLSNSRPPMNTDWGVFYRNLITILLQKFPSTAPAA
jgi:hypothetical protein